MAPRNKVIILENFQVAPASGVVSELSIPLTCSDMFWIDFPPVHHAIFYQHPVSVISFSETIVPGLKNSLSVALKHFPLVAGNLIIPPDPIEPVIRYVNGNSVPFATAESSSPDFEGLVGNEPRICGEFYPLIPRLPESSESAESKIYPPIAIQVTMFPGEGFCIGITYNHVLGDGATIYSFIKAWSTIGKFGEDEATKRDELSPIHDREVMKVHTKEIDDSYLRDLRSTKLKDSNMDGMFESFEEDTTKVRATFVISQEDIQKLKKHVFDRQTSIRHLSSFTVVTAYVWTCLVQSGNLSMNIVDEDEEQYIIFGADFRGRTQPLIPSNYFGNCLVGFMIKAKTNNFSGNEAFLRTAKLFGDLIHQRFSCDGIQGGFKSILDGMEEIKDVNNIFSVGGSPRQNYYGFDFGWGKPRKVEMTSIDALEAMSLSACRDTSEGLEIGMALPKERMDIFTEIFSKGFLGL